MNITCFYDQTPFTLSMEEKIAALRKMQAENLQHYDARCPRCGRVNKVSRERLEMFTPGWEEAIKSPQAAPMAPANASMPAPSMPAQSMPIEPAAVAARPKTSPPARRRHKPAAKKAGRKAKPAAKKSVKKTAKKPAKKKVVRKTSKTRKKK
jgi:hypothetical protein